MSEALFVMAPSWADHTVTESSHHLIGVPTRKLIDLPQKRGRTEVLNIATKYTDLSKLPASLVLHPGMKSNSLIFSTFGVNTLKCCRRKLQCEKDGIIKRLVVLNSKKAERISPRPKLRLK